MDHSGSMSSKIQKIALVGNPNTGKSSLFNWLTGLNQKVGNFPGVTVDRKSGTMFLHDESVEVIDFPVLTLFREVRGRESGAGCFDQ